MHSKFFMIFIFTVSIETFFFVLFTFIYNKRHTACCWNFTIGLLYIWIGYLVLSDIVIKLCYFKLFFVLFFQNMLKKYIRKFPLSIQWNNTTFHMPKSHIQQMMTDIFDTLLMFNSPKMLLFINYKQTWYFFFFQNELSTCCKHLPSKLLQVKDRDQGFLSHLFLLRWPWAFLHRFMHAQ